MSRTSRNLILFLAVALGFGGRAFAAPTPIGSITITGGEQSSGGVMDTGTVTATLNGVSISVTYGQYSSPEGIASALGALISQNCNMPVYARATGSTLNFYTKGSNVLNSATLSSTSSNPSLFASSSFQVNGGGSWSSPAIATLSLPEGPPSMGFVIYGTNFGSAQGSVTIGNVSATIVSWSSTSITVQVPSGLTAGFYPLVVTMPTWFIQTGGLTFFEVDVPFPCN